MSQVIVLNADYSFLQCITWQNAVCLVLEKKAEIVRESEKFISNCTKSVTVNVPMVIRLIKYIRSAYRKNVPFSKKNVFARDNQICAYCGKTIESVSDCTIDHVIPRSQGGGTTFENCVTACKPCNSQKADKSLKECGMKLRYKPVKPTISEHIAQYTKKYGISELMKEISERV